MKTLVFVLMLGFATPTFAQSRLVWTDESVAEVLSNVTLGSAIVLDTVKSAHEEDKGKAFLRQGIASGTALGVSILLKNVIKSPRPCVPDCGIDTDYSMPSGHTALAFSSVRGWRYSFAISTAYMRVAAGKHRVKDTLVGAAIGIGAQQLANRLVR